jgi:protein tyrosine phosphatase (PTP) superfamily phosphohydrolase (DUF442 family)
MEKQMKKIIILLITAVAFSCSGKAAKQTNADTVTAATGHSPASYKHLPSSSKWYKVIGHVKGLAGYVVKYSDDFYRGGDIKSEEGMKALVSHGIKTVVAVTPTALERNLCTKYNVSLVELPYSTNGLSPAQVETYIQTFEVRPGPYYIHCHGGSHRAGVLGAGYRHHILKWSQEKALVEFGRLGGDLKIDDKKLRAIGFNLE